MTNTAHYDALRSRDRRFDGQFFVGVRTTGIYCRPVCRAKLPRPASCTFFRSAAQAESEGFRPCLRCRPELAPGRSLTDASSRIATAALERIAAGALNGHSVADIARELCVGERHLRRVVSAEFGATPVELAQTQRLLLAKQLLTESDLPVSRIAYASGFTSLSRFNSLFLARYRMSPTRLRKTRGRAATSAGTLTLLFEYRPPLDWPWLLGFLETRAIPAIEVVRDNTYYRTLRCGDHAGWFSVTPSKSHDHALIVEISESLIPALLPVRAAIRRMFDLDAEPHTIARHFESDDIMSPLVRARPGLRLPGAADVFELAVRGVVGQQISVAGARTVAGRVHDAFGERFDGPDGLTRLAVTPAQLAAADPAAISALGMPLSRARTLVVLAQRVAEGTISLEPTADMDAAIAVLCTVPGIGPWTAEYIAMRGYHWPDAFPAGDLGIRNALRGLDARTRAEPWAPWRAYAAIHLWASLSAKSG